MGASALQYVQKEQVRVVRAAYGSRQPGRPSKLYYPHLNSFKKDAPWRNQPASDKQIQKLKDLQVSAGHSPKLCQRVRAVQQISELHKGVTCCQCDNILPLTACQAGGPEGSLWQSYCSPHKHSLYCRSAVHTVLAAALQLLGATSLHLKCLASTGARFSMRAARPLCQLCAQPCCAAPSPAGRCKQASHQG